LFAIAGFFAMVTNDQVKKSYGRSDTGPLFSEKIRDWESRSPVQFQAADPLVIGAPAGQALMTITEFADFRCIHCKHAAPVMKAFISAHPDARLEYYAWPLDGECNTAIQQTNGASCLLARTVFCAAKVGGPKSGWSAHEYVFANQDMWSTKSAVEGNMTEIAKVAGVPNEQLLACTQSPEAKEAIEKQSAAGTALNIQGTPTIYVNGKKLELGQSLQVLNMAYERLKAAAK
jgi:protein-disulfide isomerase